MRKAFGIFGRLVLLAAVLIAVAVAYSTARGYTIWYFRVSGSVTVDGHNTGGYMHANTQKTVLLITRTDGSRPETYLVPVEAGKFMIDCGEWHPMRFLPFPIRELNPPCSGFKVKPESVMDPPVDATLIRSRRSVEFSTASGKKVKAEW